MNRERYIVRKREDDIEDAIAGIIMRLSKGWKVPLLPSRRTMHLMAKVAVAVYEAAVEAYEGDSRDRSKPDT